MNASPLINPPTIYVGARESQLIAFAVRKFKDAAKAAVKDSGAFVIALSGGKSPLPFFQKLAEWDDKDIWSKTYIFFADERCVPLDDHASNYALIKDYLLDKVPVPSGQVFPAPVDAGSPAEVAAAYDETLTRFFQDKKSGPVRFDLIILGIGEDGHTASLFSGSRAMQAGKAGVVAVTDAPVAYERVTLTLPAINAAKDIFFFSWGRKKELVVQQVLEDRADLPAARIIPVKGRTSVFLDTEAAARLSAEKNFLNTILGNRH